MSAQLALSEPRRIKATHRRRRKIASGRFVQRYYDPQIGRFLSNDPVAANAGAGFNRYNYASNSPYRFIDPDGRISRGSDYGQRAGEEFDCRTRMNSCGGSDPVTFKLKPGGDGGGNNGEWLPPGSTTSAEKAFDFGSFGIPEPLFDGARGLTDSLSFGMAPVAVRVIGTDIANRGSASYRFGGLLSLVVGSGRLAYAASAKVYSKIASSGAAASAHRAWIKNAGRLGQAKNYRLPNLINKTDDELRASAGRTDLPINVVGLGQAVAGACTVGGDGCL